MNSVSQITGWRDGLVDRTKEHFELRYGSAEDSGYNEWIPLALIGPPIAGIVNVQFLRKPVSPNDVKAIVAVKKEIQFYLFDLNDPDPWRYAKYHCGTTADVYSMVHWSFFEPGEWAVLAKKRNVSANKATMPRKRSDRPGKSGR
jgi:hypothetical protein